MQTLSFHTPASQKQALLETEVEPQGSNDLPPQERPSKPSALKRLLDVVLSGFLLLLLVPTLFPIIAILIVLESFGSPIYVQLRTGKDGNTFTCFKFRTMLSDDSLPIDKRITRLGMYLRKTHLDELPQLLNVLMGDMSLVGPRPHMLSDTVRFEVLEKNYHLRHQVRPGITGLAQVNGYFGEVENLEHLQKRVELDLEYIQTRNMKMDAQILSKTLFIPPKKDV